jgi:hypothetical protein
LSAKSLNKFASLYAYERGKQLTPAYASHKILPRLRKQGKVYAIANENYYSINPLCKPNIKMQDAFWTMLEFFSGIEIDTIISGPTPASLSFIRNNRFYYIIVAESDGKKEYAQALNLERNMLKVVKNEPLELRFLFLFRSKENASKTNFIMTSKTMCGVLTYEENSMIPSISFFTSSKAK